VWITEPDLVFDGVPKTARARAEAQAPHTLQLWRVQPDQVTMVGSADVEGTDTHDDVYGKCAWEVTGEGELKLQAVAIHDGTIS
jgi:hypothetical protein